MKKTRLLIASLAFSLPLAAGPSPRITVMTRNVYPGLDDASGVVAAVLGGDTDEILTQVELLWRQVVATDIPMRASALADEIAAKRPALVGLQEAALWRSQYPADFSPTPNAHHVEYDMVGLLLGDLRTRGLHYEVVAESKNIDIELPRWNPDPSGAPDPEDIRWTDRDVLLARVDNPSELKILSATSGRFSTYIDFGGGIAIPRGWVSADVRARGGTFRVVSAHLEDMDISVQTAQAEELLTGPGDTALPTLFVGDYNSNADLAPPEGAYGLLTASGLSDAWRAVHPSDPGFTCCQDPLLQNPASQLSERVDLVLYRGPFQVLEAARLGADTSDKIAGLWPSDHAGVAVIFRLPR